MASMVRGMLNRVINLPATTMPPFMTQSNKGLRSANKTFICSAYCPGPVSFFSAVEQIGGCLNVLDFFKHGFWVNWLIRLEICCHFSVFSNCCRFINGFPASAEADCSLMGSSVMGNASRTWPARNRIITTNNISHPACCAILARFRKITNRC